MTDQWITRKTLLLRTLNPDDESAWEEFVDYYGRFIYHIILKMGISSSTSDDVAQQIVIKLWKKINTYDSSKGSFRPWLSTVIRNSVNEHYRKENRRKENAFFEGEENQISVENDIDQMIQNEWENHLTEEAIKHVKEVFSGKAVEAFLMGLDGFSNADIAEKLDIALPSVKVLKARVKSCFISEMRKLTRNMERR
ncbi:probable RNA polymerase sigma-H factor [Lentisphaera araneosa HTCC2155]|jgi:RNA polymerase sigma factor (sigma-70 family)|uniref:Probable RNA polymerase sigma-H factor n=1 Tax=Lentisphaera araneosa HTCC2155 TaxID=313628 RepID=A6DNV2_9BACT|nr:sigma-70 family RNA polymerase sigma factor [Lentisphaera araneosa]EDM26761.1 probable RNA polymerase sigma-H factor [Lentisphaera araneosa HTCC2155]